ncbi:MAG: DUF3048 domain-containing protein [Actinomycetota bacterium]|nr:DUF3048 domain-containing protein [Actinomycetota bacterium]
MKKSNRNVAFIKNFIIALIIALMSLMLLFSFACKKEEIITEETKIDVEETSTTEIQEETETTEKSISELEITGNINIINGFEISDDVLDSRPFAVMINNAGEARPQSGLNKADCVIEVVDEGGITRLIGIFSSKDADIIGPIRSARQYYAELARMFDPVYVFWGTYPEGYKIVENMDMDVLTPLGDQSGASNITANMSDGQDAWRDSSRVAPHNAYSSSEKLKSAAVRNGHLIEGGQSPFSFKLDASEEKRGSISDIKIDFSVASFASDFIYDKALNNYKKSTGGTTDIDRETNENLYFNNVIALITDIANSGDSAGHMIVRTTGSGKAFYFFDGNVIEGTWERTSILDPMIFKDTAGNEVLFNRGTTYLSMVQGADRVIY